MPRPILPRFPPPPPPPLLPDMSKTVLAVSTPNCAELSPRFSPLAMAPESDKSDAASQAIPPAPSALGPNSEPSAYPGFAGRGFGLSESPPIMFIGALSVPHVTAPAPNPRLTSPAVEYSAAERAARPRTTPAISNPPFITSSQQINPIGSTNSSGPFLANSNRFGFVCFNAISWPALGIVPVPAKCIALNNWCK